MIIEEQEEILNIKDKNTIVSASAGSGKTTVMIKKILKVVTEEKISVKDILVLTYTRAAASEMKSRLENKLMELEGDYYKNQIDLLSTADISTFHSFCQKLIERNFFILGISPNFAVMDEKQTMQITNKALNIMTDEFSKNNPDQYYMMLQVFGNGRTENCLKETVLKLYNFLLSIQDDKWQEEALKLFENNFAEQYLNNQIVGTIQNFCSKFKVLQQKAKLLELDKYVADINGFLSELEKISKNNSFVTNIKNINELSFSIFRTQKDDGGVGFKISYIKSELAKYIAKIKEKNYGDEQNIKISYDFCKQVVSLLFDLKDNFSNIYTSLKRNENMFDYSDLEQYALEVLKNDAVKKQIKNQYKYVFVDEFQDANEIQEQILSQIAKTNNRFMVGDVKQSIYAFRQSNPEIFLSIQDMYEKRNDSEHKTLNSNFRSEKNILDFVNIIFSKLMTIESADIDYKGTSQFCARAEYKKNDFPSVVLDIIETTKEKTLPPKQVYSVLNHQYNIEENQAQNEALAVASRITSMLGKPLYDKDAGLFRPATYADFAVLLRRRGEYQKTFAYTLSELGIPVAVNSNIKLFDTTEGQQITNLLSVLDNSKNDIPLISTLICFGDLSENDLSKIRNQYPNEEYFYLAVDKFVKDNASGEQNNSNTQIANKLQNFINNINKWRECISSYGVYFALHKIYEQNHIFEKNMDYPDGETKNLVYVSYANIFKNNNISVGEFLSTMQSPTMQNVVSSTFLVNITTIHSSKGLEYPVVFVCNIADDLFHANNSEIILSKKHGVAPKYKDISNRMSYDNVFFDTLKAINKKQETAENIRLLYVALTRAKNHLFIVGSSSKFEFTAVENTQDIYSKSNYLDLIVGCFPDEIIENINNKKDCLFDSVKINIITLGEKIFNEKINKINHKEIQNRYVKELADYIQNDFAKKQKIAFKNSVTALVQDDYASKNYAPKTFDTKEHMADYDRQNVGIIYHKILEKIDFSVLEKDDFEQIVKQIVCDNFDQSEAKTFFDYMEKNDLLNNIKNNIKLIKSLISDGDKIVKEQQFMLRKPHNQIVENSDCNDNILIQGVVDMLIVGKKITLIDYKMTSIKSDKILIDKYSKQIQLYKLACETVLNTKVEQCFILNLKQNKLIKV